MATSSKMVSERDAILRERAAWAKGADYGTRLGYHRESASVISIQAEVAFPVPTITRPRVARIEHAECESWDIGPREFRVVDGAIEHRDADTCWLWKSVSDHWWDLDPETVIPLADLLANPTEEVEDDGSVEGSK